MTSCQKVTGCGDGFLCGDEECDDGNKQNGDGCSKKCEAETCEKLGVDWQQGECDSDKCTVGKKKISSAVTCYRCDDPTLVCNPQCANGSTTHASATGAPLADCLLGCVDTSQTTTCKLKCPDNTTVGTPYQEYCCKCGSAPSCSPPSAGVGQCSLQTVAGKQKDGQWVQTGKVDCKNCCEGRYDFDTAGCAFT